jgi:uncharacterized protein with von Willebrand factor type A (vWA) domain
MGGSMDPHVKVMEELFSAAKSEFRICSRSTFTTASMRASGATTPGAGTDQTPTWDVLRTYGPDWKAIFVGDAAMSPYEITHPGGASEHWNPEAGQVWLSRALGQWPGHLWINPLPEPDWAYAQSTALIQRIFGGRMVPMTTEGIARGVKLLR